VHLVDVIKEVYDNTRVHGMEYFKTHIKKQQIVFFAVSQEIRE